MQGILFLKDSERALEAMKLDAMTDVEWLTLNRKAITYIKMTVDDILVALEGLPTTYEVWEKLKAMWENTMRVN